MKSRRRLDNEQWQPRLWVVVAGLLLLSLYVIAFIVRNDEQISVDFVLFAQDVSLIWAMIFIFALGLLGGVLLSQLYRRRRAKRRGEPADAVGDLAGRGEAESQPGG
jgi:uncharacterized integral membrane protein